MQIRVYSAKIERPLFERCCSLFRIKSLSATFSQVVKRFNIDIAKRKRRAPGLEPAAFIMAGYGVNSICMYERQYMQLCIGRISEHKATDMGVGLIGKGLPPLLKGVLSQGEGALTGIPVNSC
jgi:hypothetical protein